MAGMGSRASRFSCSIVYLGSVSLVEFLKYLGRVYERLWCGGYLLKAIA